MATGEGPRPPGPPGSDLPRPPADVVKRAKQPPVEIPPLTKEGGQRLAEIAQQHKGPNAIMHVLKGINPKISEKLAGYGTDWTAVALDAATNLEGTFGKGPNRKAALSGFRQALAAAGIDSTNSSTPIGELAREYIQSLEAAGQEAVANQPQSADEIDPNNPFGFLKDVDATRLVNFIQGEHPQNIALILSHLPQQQAALVLTALHPDVQSDVAMRIALMDRADPKVVQQVAELLRQRIPPESAYEQMVGGVRHLVGVLNAADATARNTILDALDESHPELADEIKKNAFTFEDIPTGVRDADIHVIVRNVDTRDIALALRGADPALLDKFRLGMSARSWQQLQEDIEKMGPQPLSSIEDAQQKIVAVTRRLQQAEEIRELRAGEDLVYTAQEKAAMQQGRPAGTAVEATVPLSEEERMAVGFLRQMKAQDHPGRVRELLSSHGTFSQEGAEREISRREALEQRLVAQRAADPTQRVTQPDDVTQRLGGAWGDVQGAIAQTAGNVTQRIQQDQRQALAQDPNRQPATPIQPPEPVPTHTEVTHRTGPWGTIQRFFGADASIVKEVPDAPQGPRRRFFTPQSLISRGGEIAKENPERPSEEIAALVNQEYIAERMRQLAQEQPGLTIQQATDMAMADLQSLRNQLR